MLLIIRLHSFSDFLHNFGGIISRLCFEIVAFRVFFVSDDYNLNDLRSVES